MQRRKPASIDVRFPRVNPAAQRGAISFRPSFEEDEHVHRIRLAFLVTLAMLAFAGNSLLCRLALQTTAIDPASFTTIRLVAGALVLWVLARARGGGVSTGSWPSALALFVYAAAFSFAYVSLSAATGALLVFGAVQVTMIGYGLVKGERFSRWQILGLLLAVAGLVGFLLPGLSTPPLEASLVMVSAGIAWGVYSLRGRSSGAPLATTAGNFLRAAPVSVALSLLLLAHATWDTAGFLYAMASGALTSGIGYALWYSVLPSLKATNAAVVQLCVPVIAALGGVLLLGEAVSVRLALASAAVLGGIAIVILGKAAR